MSFKRHLGYSSKATGARRLAKGRSSFRNNLNQSASTRQRKRTAAKLKSTRRSARAVGFAGASRTSGAGYASFKVRGGGFVGSSNPRKDLAGMLRNKRRTAKQAAASRLNLRKARSGRRRAPGRR